MLLALPPPLRRAVEAELARADPRRIQAHARSLSERYRAHDASGRGRFVHGPEDALAYAALILPQSHAQLAGALRMVPLRVGGWSPRSLLDLGAGPGTAAWAAAATWPTLERVVHCEADPEFLRLGPRLSAASPSAAVRDAQWREGDLVEEGLPGGTFDLVVLGLVLSELSPRERRVVLAAAWRRCGGVLVIVEPGTPSAFEVVRAGREQLLRAGARVVAPCPHEGACPLSEGAWCHFAERSERPPFQRRVKDASLPWEDAKFSLAALSRLDAARPWARVLHQPRKQKGGLLLSLCTADGLADEWIAKARGASHRRARKLSWGDAVEAEDELRGP